MRSGLPSCNWLQPRLPRHGLHCPLSHCVACGGEGAGGGGSDAVANSPTNPTTAPCGTSGQSITPFQADAPRQRVPLGPIRNGTILPAQPGRAGGLGQMLGILGCDGAGDWGLAEAWGVVEHRCWLWCMHPTPLLGGTGFVIRLWICWTGPRQSKNKQNHPTKSNGIPLRPPFAHCVCNVLLCAVVSQPRDEGATDGQAQTVEGACHTGEKAMLHARNVRGLDLVSCPTPWYPSSRVPVTKSHGNLQCTLRLFAAAPFKVGRTVRAPDSLGDRADEGAVQGLAASFQQVIDDQQVANIWAQLELEEMADISDICERIQIRWRGTLCIFFRGGGGVNLVSYLCGGGSLFASG